MEDRKILAYFLKHKCISTDSRNIPKGAVFFALKGANFNGNKFAASALEKGASVAVIDETEYFIDDRTILVENVLLSLQNVARLYRSSLTIPFVGITGTNGKTTTKELISAVLSKKYLTHFTKGNFNNHIGVPLTLLAIPEKAEIAVIEMGANHPGEIHELCTIADPDFALITNVGKAHLEGFGSFEGVLNTKTELYRYIHQKKGKLFVNADDKLLLSSSENCERMLYPDHRMKIKNVRNNPYLHFVLEYNGVDYEVGTKLIGAYNLNNSLAAIAVGLYFDVPVQRAVDAINEYSPSNNRSQLIKTDKNTLVMDAYNANPSSMKLSVENFVGLQSDNPVLILGDMLELGAGSVGEHQRIISLCEELKLHRVYFVGQQFAQAASGNLKCFENVSSLMDYFKLNPLVGATILIKGSRGIQLERLREVL